MVHELQLRIAPRDAFDERSICDYLLRERGMRCTAVRVLKRSIDARQRRVYVTSIITPPFSICAKLRFSSCLFSISL